MSGPRTLVSIAIAITALALAAPPLGAGGTVQGPFGSGAAQVWLVWPTGRPRGIVVFGHGWKVAPPSPRYRWVGQFRPWLDHLAAGGNIVVFPRYQVGGDTSGAARAEDFRAGLTTAYRRLGRLARLPVVVVGYSYGASLAFGYAANARAWRLPVPSAIDAVFPAAPIPGLPFPALRASTRVLMQVGAQDVEAGRSGADAFWRRLGGGSSLRQFEIVRSRPGFVADHAAPKGASATAREVFWRPLDRLVALAAGRR